MLLPSFKISFYFVQSVNEKEKKAQRIVQKVQRQQVLKRLRNAQEIQRRLEELEVEQRDLECRGVELEKMFRGERHGKFSFLLNIILFDFLNDY